MRLWLKKIRISNHMTQASVAQRAGISRSYYTRIENGVYFLPTETAKKIANTLNFRWTRFYEESENRLDESH